MDEHETSQFLSRSLQDNTGREAFKSWLFRLADVDHSQTVTMEQLELVLKAVTADHIDTCDLAFEGDKDDPQFVARQIMAEYDTGQTGFLSEEEFMVLADLIVSNYERKVAQDAERNTKHIGPYMLHWKLGEGASGEVYLAVHEETGEKKAIKIIPFAKVTEVSRLDVEVKAMLMLKHKNIVQLEEVLEDEKRVYLVMELCGGGSLADYVHIKPLSEELARFYFKQMMDAVAYCHEQGVCHRDLKLENLLLDDEGTVHISDFGHAGIFREGWDMFSTAVGSLFHLSPEQVEGRCYSGEKMDLWAIGVALYRMVAGKPPFYSKHINQLLDDIKAVRYTCPPTMSRFCADFIGRLLKYDPEERWDFDQLLVHPWLAGLTTAPSLEMQSVTFPHVEVELSDIKSAASALNVVCVRYGDSTLKCHYPKKDLKFKIELGSMPNVTPEQVEVKFRLKKGQTRQFQEMVEALLEVLQERIDERRSSANRQ